MSTTDAEVRHGLLTMTVVSAVLPPIGILLTTFRLYERTIQRRLWWDDAVAAVTLVLAIIFTVTDELLVRLREYPGEFSQDTKIHLYYMGAIFYYLVTWGAKVSILFTIIRLLLPGRFRRTLGLFTVAFLVAVSVLFAQVFWVCETEPAWKKEQPPQCDLGRNVAIAQVICDVTTDVVLIAAPVSLVWRVKLQRPQKIRIIAIFSTSIIMTAVSLYHADLVLRDAGISEDIAAVAQASVSLIVANLNVIVALIFRISSDSADARPASAGMKSILTFGSAGRRTKRANNLLSTTFLMSDEGMTIPTSAIVLQDLGSSTREDADNMSDMAGVTDMDKKDSLMERKRAEESV
ncbi:uncharacterized protein LAESUDRAFT_687446 [Laetiporus sulphureus 93-53]|uniref:Rhodopsin domain-containing protein n=1 Tax=Laetiporus sulphureus 93-53 TaxID=1314785 RepID=A0A165BEM4_9APHY|nr:uncharacterized protein LAESUDRAFT_687446 [Laetiporus sulphureus 93-53]KZT00888.1 hypothetical protein LAESUDRAFT_687446 [Laetiporus sulphureus 93-53]